MSQTFFTLVLKMSDKKANSIGMVKSITASALAKSGSILSVIIIPVFFDLINLFNIPCPSWGGRLNRLNKMAFI